MSETLFKNCITYFAPSERLPLDMIVKQSRVLQKLWDLQQIFDVLPDVTIILNRHRQVVFGNRALLELLGLQEIRRILGTRLGEILLCTHAGENKAGCGTSESCSTCGAAWTILNSLEGNKVSHECRITVKRGEHHESLDFLVSGTPLRLEGEDFTIISLADVSDEKRRKALERIFFHDIINTADSLRAIVELLGYVDEPAKIKELLRDLGDVTNILIEEILEQRDLASAENNELTVRKVPVQSEELLKELVNQFKNHQVSRGRFQRIDDRTENVLFVSDPVLLKRVLGNMLKNALEATKPGDTITLGAVRKDRQVHFWVHNPSPMPRQVQLQVFKRSFSTKGKGRGLGTYSMKLLTERYLKGTIWFTVEDEGTTFLADYPLYLMDYEAAENL